ncbi:MAG: hypothetical protein RIM72_09915 [Alphaproteobacteria bacterium]
MLCILRVYGLSKQMFCGAAERLDFENRASYCAGHFGGKKGLFLTLIEPQ